MNNTHNPQPQTPPRKHKGGRPSLPADKKRTVCKKVYFTREQARLVEAAADANNMSESNYIVQMAMTGKVVAPIPSEFARDLRAVANLANNMNQLAHLAHLQGYCSVVSEILVELPRVRGVLDKVYGCV